MIFENDREVKAPEDNRIIGDDLMHGSSVIRFRGSGNILCAEPGVTLEGSEIVFCGDNALLYLSAGKHPYKLRLDLWRETTVYFGEDNYFNGILTAVISERQNLIAGGGGMFSSGIWIRTADPHPVYDASTGRRLNMSRSILIGDHVWIGQDALILKGCRIGSGSILSARAVLAGKEQPSNSIYAGNPAKQIRSNVFFETKSVHNYTKEKSRRSMESAKKDFIYAKPEAAVDICGIFGELTETADAEQRLAVLKEKIISGGGRDRFCIAESRKRRSLLAFGKEN